MKNDINRWGREHKISAPAMEELFNLLKIKKPIFDSEKKSEHDIQNRIRADAAFAGASLWRNNSGVARELSGKCLKCGKPLPNNAVTQRCPNCKTMLFRGDRIRYVRYGLGNDSKKLNEKFKSPDLVGITPVSIREKHVGRTFGIFTGVEVKAGKSDGKRLSAQENFLNYIRLAGGVACFAACPNDYFLTLNRFIENDV